MPRLINHFGGQIIHGATISFPGFIPPTEIRPAKIYHKGIVTSKFDVALLIEEDVFGFDVAMDYFVLVQVFYRRDHLTDHLLRLALVETHAFH